VADAIVIGSPDVVPNGAGVDRIREGSLVALARTPHLGWSVRAPKLD